GCQARDRGDDHHTAAPRDELRQAGPRRDQAGGHVGAPALLPGVVGDVRGGADAVPARVGDQDVDAAEPLGRRGGHLRHGRGGRPCARRAPRPVSAAPAGARSPSAAATWPSGLPRRPTSTTRAPSATNRSATAAPIPVPAPVTTATRPSSQPLLSPPPRSVSP